MFGFAFGGGLFLPPALFADFIVTELGDGTRMAVSPYVSDI